MITICVGLQNRTDNMINFLLKSMNECEHKDKLALSVVDVGTTDVSDLKTEIQKHWGGKFNFTKMDLPFGRYVYNHAVENAESNLIFVCDADMTLPKNFIQQYVENVPNRKHVWFPICFSLYKGVNEYVIKDENGWWRETGFGMMGIFKDVFMNLGGYQVKTTWGGPDDMMFKMCNKQGLKIKRENCVGLFHNWHPKNTEFHRKGNV